EGLLVGRRVAVRPRRGLCRKGLHVERGRAAVASSALCRIAGARVGVAVGVRLERAGVLAAAPRERAEQDEDAEEPRTSKRAGKRRWRGGGGGSEGGNGAGHAPLQRPTDTFLQSGARGDPCAACGAPARPRGYFLMPPLGRASGVRSLLRQ